MAELGADELAHLEEERRFLLRSLDDLEREHAAGDVDAADYAAVCQIDGRPVFFCFFTSWFVHL